MINLSKIVFGKFRVPSPELTRASVSSMSDLRLMVCQRNPPSFISSWDGRLNKGAWARRSSALFAGNEFSDAGVAANVLAANG